MDTYESRPLLPMPFSKKLKEMTDEELTKLLAGANNYNVLIPALIEANTRKDRAITELTKQVAFLEEKALKKAGRPKTRYYVNGQELTDDYLIYLIDYDYFTVRELEKEVGAGKKQLRNRYNKAKQKKANKGGCNKWKSLDQSCRSASFLYRKRFYENDDIVDRPIIELTTMELKNWARKKIISEKLTKKLYYNMSVIIRQSLDYLVELGELPTNPYSNFKINPSLFTPVIEKEAEYEVFNEVEEQQVKALAMQKFEENPALTSALAVVINFSLGLRVGELVALKWKDLKGSYLHIRRMEQRQFTQQPDGRWTSYPKVVEHTKLDAGYHMLYLVTSTLELFNKVKEANLQNGYTCNPEDYIFLYDGVRITFHSINKKYNHLCKELGIVKKGNHKTRKTCLTKIADNPNINLKDAMQFSGHRDVHTYIKHYCFSRYSDEQKRNELEKTLNK